MRLALGLVVLSAAEPDDLAGTCLLSLRSSVAKRDQSPADAVADARAWAALHAPRHEALVHLRATLSRSLPPGLAVGLDGYISQSRASTEACHAKTLEAKRTLDGLTHQVAALSEQMSSQIKVVETNTVALEEAIAAKHAADGELLTAIQVCDTRPDTTLLLQYRSDLDTLEQLRSGDQTAVSSDPSAAAQAADTDAPADARAWSRAACARYAAMLSQAPSADAGAQSAQDCSTLQAQLEASYAEISLLYQNSATSVSDALVDCKATANTEHEGALAAVNLQIQQSTKLILAAKDLRGALEPLLDDVSLTTSKVAEHIAWLEQNCQVETALTEHLRKVRDLIDTLAACPGRHDFHLAVPSVTIP